MSVSEQASDSTRLLEAHMGRAVLLMAELTRIHPQIALLTLAEILDLLEETFARLGSASIFATPLPPELEESGLAASPARNLTMDRLAGDTDTPKDTVLSVLERARVGASLDIEQLKVIALERKLTSAARDAVLAAITYISRDGADSLFHLGLTTRERNTLMKRGNIHTIPQLRVAISTDKLRLIFGIGEGQRADSIRASLVAYDQRLAQSA